ncbi:MAG: ERCC4 domain-containing protein [Candidatus Micrarchaeia archaeon]
MEEVKIQQGHRTEKIEQSQISEFSDQKDKQYVEIFIDSRESDELANLTEQHGVKVNLKQLEIGDAVVSNRIVIERKTSSDFESSIIDNRLFEQATKMSENYEIPILIIEGHMKAERIRQSAFIGAYLSIIMNYGIHVINTKNIEETAKYISLIAKKEQMQESRPLRLLVKTKTFSFRDEQLRVLQSFPSIGPSTAEKILQEFGTLERFFTSDIKEIERVIGKAKAKRVYLLIHSNKE